MNRTELPALITAVVLVAGCGGGPDTGDAAAGAAGPTEDVPSEPGAQFLLTEWRHEEDDLDLVMTDGKFRALEPTGRLEAVFVDEKGTKIVILGPRPDADDETFTVSFDLGDHLESQVGEQTDQRFLATEGECAVTYVEDGPDLVGTVTCGRVAGTFGQDISSASGAFRASPRDG